MLKRVSVGMFAFFALCGAAVYAMSMTPVAAGVAVAVDPVASHPVAASSFGATVADTLAKTIWPLISALVAYLVGIAVRKIATKYHLDGLLAKVDYLEKLALQGIALAEEKAAQMAKDGLDQKMAGHEKLAIAVGYICNLMPSVSEEQAQNIVHSLLARIPGLGASGDQAVAVSSTTVAVQG